MLKKWYWVIAYTAYIKQAQCLKTWWLYKNFWKNVLGPDETELRTEFFLRSLHCVKKKKKKKEEHTNMKTSSQRWSKMEEASWFGTCLPSMQGNKWNPKFTQVQYPTEWCQGGF